MPRPHYGTGEVQITRQPRWLHLWNTYRWHMTFTDCDQHSSSGFASTEHGCMAQAVAAETAHAMHHARLIQRGQFPGRIRAD